MFGGDACSLTVGIFEDVVALSREVCIDSVGLDSTSSYLLEDSPLVLETVMSPWDGSCLVGPTIL